MLSVAPVRSAGGAASYFAKDDYYSGEHPSEMSEWGGEGAAALGLEGEVGKAAFETLLNGTLPDGTVVNAHEHRRAGIDLTFSMPKSASVLAYVAGDERLLAAHRAAVRQTMAWAEKKFAEARSYEHNRSGEAVRTGNLVYAMFQHDTSRKLDPQAHIHVVIAAITRTVAGQWRALWNGELWKNNAAIGSAYHAALRSEIEKLGYETRITGKHGQFEIEGVGAERLVMIGDRKQLQPIDAGKAFSLVQSHEPAMANLEESQRQRTDAMKAVAGLTRAGAFREAFEVLGDRVTSAGVDYRVVAARRWLALSPDERERTALYASGRETRSEVNALVQTGLRAEGVLTGEGLELTTLQKVNATREELRMAQTYRKRQVVEVFRKDRPAGLDAGRYEVLSVNAKGIVSLRNEAGRRVRFEPGAISADDRRDALAVYETEKVRLYQGDQIRWSANDKDRALFNSAQSRVLDIGADGVRIENARGNILNLRRDDPMLERVGLAYAINMHQAQGMTSDKGIGVMHSSERMLSNQRLTYVMATRVRDDLEIVTNDRDALLRTIDGNRGDKASALETVGEKVVDSAPVRGRPEGPSSGGKAGGLDPASLRAEPEKHRGMQSPVPEKRLDLGL